MGHSEALTYLGLPEAQLNRLIDAGLIETDGRGRGLRLLSADVTACGQLWKRLKPLLPSGSAPDAE
jgi:hypothetical protein